MWAEARKRDGITPTETLPGGPKENRKSELKEGCQTSGIPQAGNKLSSKGKNNPGDGVTSPIPEGGVTSLVLESRALTQG